MVVTYDGNKEAPEHFGSDKNGNVKPYKFDLEPNEYITNISGHAGSTVFEVVIHTSNGRKFCTGTPDKNCPFDLCLPKNVMVIGLGGAVNGHLHNIKCAYVKLDDFSLA